jgi:hypothetical protein
MEDSFDDAAIDEIDRASIPASKPAAPLVPAIKADAPTEEMTPLSKEELAALGNAARDLLPDEFLVGKPMKWSWETGRWHFDVFVGKDTEQVFVRSDEEFGIDLRSYTETETRWWERKKTHCLGGRRVDGWINPARDQLPDQDKDKWKLKNNKPKDPWVDAWQITLRRLGDKQFFTWEAQYSAKRGLGEFLDAAYKEAGNHPGEMPVVTLRSYQRDKFNGEKEWVPQLKIIRWAPFGPGASPPADARNLERIQKKLKEINDDLAPDKAQAKSLGGDMDDEIPF